METILLTGAPGFIGTFMGASFLQKGFKVIFLARSAGKKTAQQRVEESLLLVDASVLDKNFQVIDGDVTLENCDISIDMIRDVTMVFHAAGKLDYSWNKKDETAFVNINGTKNVLKLTKFMPALKKFVFISTAYVCGSWNGIFREDQEFERRPIFDNAYEFTKLKAENRVRAWSKKSKVDTYIFRPSIVVGRSSDGVVIGCTGYYSFMKVFHFIANSEQLARNDLGLIDSVLNVPGNNKASLNITPVDWLISTINDVLDRNAPGIYHVVDEEPQTYGFWLDVGTKYLGFSNVCASNKQSTDRPVAVIEKMIKRGTGSYRCFVENHPQFDIAKLKTALGDSYIPCVVDTQLVHTLLGYAKKRSFDI